MEKHLKSTSAFVLAVLLAPLTVNAGPFENVLRNIVKPDAECSMGQLVGAKSRIELSLQRLQVSPDQTIGSFCSSLRESAEKRDSHCYTMCESEYAAQFAERKEGQQNAARERADRDERDRTDALEKQRAAEERNANLKAGRIKPADLDEAAIAFDARRGEAVVISPKLRPDGHMYYMHGKIKIAGDEPTFLAVPSMSKLEEQNVAVYNLRGIGQPINMRESTDYFKVVVPKNLQEYYFNNARIEGGVDLVGRYVSNSKFKTVAGQDKTVPVFEVVYFTVW